jgi:hypothetical protein
VVSPKSSGNYALFPEFGLDGFDALQLAYRKVNESFDRVFMHGTGLSVYAVGILDFTCSTQIRRICLKRVLVYTSFFGRFNGRASVALHTW